MRKQKEPPADDGETEVDDALAAFGLQADPEQLEQVPADSGPVCEVWPAHVDALNLFLACLGQLQHQIGMGGSLWRGAQAVNVAQEARWLEFHGKRQVQVVRQYREIEAEAVRILNDREAQAQASSQKR